ncbi:hypothetical protein EOA28_11020 [Mesorhizobium sp. M2A.F.Ca.ET.067.02.1.1]|nr:hypothetical protein EOA28_11020 [Mesorhizobium sp. M2A.F.Ca.ET.067.02.1.1]
MSTKSAQRFWENDMHQNKDLKRVARIRFDATRFSRTLSKKRPAAPTSARGPRPASWLSLARRLKA